MSRIVAQRAGEDPVSGTAFPLLLGDGSLRLVTSGHAVEGVGSVTLCEVGSEADGVLATPEVECAVIASDLTGVADIAVLEHDGSAFEAFQFVPRIPSLDVNLNSEKSPSRDVAIPGFSDRVDSNARRMPHLVAGEILEGSALTAKRQEHALRAAVPEGFSGAPVLFEWEEGIALAGVVAAALDVLGEGAAMTEDPWLSMVSIDVVYQLLLAA